MKKIIKIILINLLIVILMFLGLEFYTCLKFELNILKPSDFIRYFNVVFRPISADKYFYYLYNWKIVKYSPVKMFRLDENLDSKKKPVILFGCSFTYGREETISHKLAMLTGRPVLNRSGIAWGLSHLLYQVRMPDFYDKYWPFEEVEPEYVIYIYIEDHIYRLDKFRAQPTDIAFQPGYKYENNNLIEIKPKFYDRFVSIAGYYDNYTFRHPEKAAENRNLVYYYLKEAYEEIHKHWSDTKFVVLIYPVYDGSYSPVLKELEKENIMVLDLRDLIQGADLLSSEYKEEDGYHPNAKAYDTILPPLIEKLKL